MTHATRPLNVVAELPRDPVTVTEVRRRLRVIRDDLLGNAILRPADLPDTHFTRLVVIEDPRGELPPVLAWESNHDGREVDYLTAVAREALRGDRVLQLDLVWEFCAGYPGVRDTTAWVRWMRAHAVPTRTFYCAYRGISKRRLDNDRRVHAAVRAYLDAHRDELAALAPVDAHARIRDHLRTIPGLDLSSDGDGELAGRLRFWRGRLQLGAGALALVPLLPLLGVGYLALRRKEATDPSDEFPHPVRAAEDLIHAEDHVLQNQLTHVVDLKPGLLRHVLLRSVLWVIDVLAATEYVHGHLGGITSIHFARWLILEDPRPRGDGPRRHRLLFFSNYDFSWDSYLGEFIDRQAAGLTAVWSNTVGFPPARNLLQAGARDEERFKNWTRKHQIPTDVWWSGVPDASVDNLREDTWIRERVERVLTDPELPEWLRRL